ncbi:phosphotransferase family protein [Microbacterium sp. W1N]|uniref:phosphotransferase family protein n=1 Tax=Microbacterium festucae TaxID=2977531 RepID=UPI0021C1DCB7|nr:phosphotransferase family protein [Microbacterium festucae]MCT9819746.1 phosphotransferase family protein [Microbacterium festucae]
MISEPDGVEVVATAADAAPGAAPLLVVDRIAAYLAGQGLGTGELSWERIGEGQSNVTYAVRLDGRDLVLRRGPRPPLPPSTHDMVREARVQRLLAAAGQPVPEIVAVCDDDSVLGVPFYVMERVDGVVVTDELPAVFADPAQHAPLAEAAVDALADLHAVDVASAPLADLGRPGGYLQRQVRRFAGLWSANTRRDLPLVAELATRLENRMPLTQRHSVVHGDYRIGNLMYGPAAPPRVAAILDWEMATLGDPLADLGYFTATYARPGMRETPLELTTVTRGAHFPDTHALVERYAARHDLDLSALGWYEALALWKAAVFCEALYTRWRAGERPGDTFGPTLEDGVPRLLDAAAERLP